MTGLPGLLWFDNTDKSLADKVAAAAQRYHEKHGVEPTVCYVHPVMLPDDTSKLDCGGVRIEAHKGVLRYHLWLAKEDTSDD